MEFNIEEATRETFWTEEYLCSSTPIKKVKLTLPAPEIPREFDWFDNYDYSDISTAPPLLFSETDSDEIEKDFGDEIFSRNPKYLLKKKNEEPTRKFTPKDQTYVPYSLCPECTARIEHVNHNDRPFETFLWHKACCGKEVFRNQCTFKDCPCNGSGWLTRNKKLEGRRLNLHYWPEFGHKGLLTHGISMQKIQEKMKQQMKKYEKKYKLPGVKIN
jgi:hypothetical protein